jgi:hypothetical protein
VNEVLEKGVEIQGDVVNVHLVCVHFAQIEHIADEGDHPVGRIVNDLDLLLLRRGELRLVQGLGRSHDRLQRIA